jgi:hypothetical protein
VCDAGDWEGAARFALDSSLSNLMPALLYDAWQQGRITTDELPAAVQEVWVHNPRPVRLIGERAWVRMFTATGFIVVSVDVIRNGERIAPAFGHPEVHPTKPVTIWRGAGLATKGRGMSWSVHRDCAVAFAQRYARHWGEHAVWKATVPPRAVLALYGDEREQEVVVNPNMLRGRVALDERIADRSTMNTGSSCKGIISGA